jgi:hypothetical protein
VWPVQESGVLQHCNFMTLCVCTANCHYLPSCLILAFVTKCCCHIHNTDIMILVFGLNGSANICFHWNILNFADPCGTGDKGWDMLEMPSTRLLLIKIC